MLKGRFLHEAAMLEFIGRFGGNRTGLNGDWEWLAHLQKAISFPYVFYVHYSSSLRSRSSLLCILDSFDWISFATHAHNVPLALHACLGPLWLHFEITTFRHHHPPPAKWGQNFVRVIKRALSHEGFCHWESVGLEGAARHSLFFLVQTVSCLFLS